MKLFLLTDGLDEFDDRDEYRSSVSNERDLIEFLHTFYQAPSVKLCVASRPLNVFKKEFGEDGNHLYLYDLTRNDIQLYVQETLRMAPSRSSSNAKVTTCIADSWRRLPMPHKAFSFGFTSLQEDSWTA